MLCSSSYALINLISNETKTEKAKIKLIIDSILFTSELNDKGDALFLRNVLKKNTASYH